jgi:hypothetical protein
MMRSWERLGAVSGILFFAAVIASFFTPETPDADDPTAEIASSIADDRTAHLVSVYLSGLATLFFLVFVGALWSRLRRAEAERGPSVLVALGGLGSAMMILVANGVFLALIEAADEGREPAAVRALFELDEIIFIGIGWTSAVFYLGAALSSLATGSLPRWLGWDRRRARGRLRGRLPWRLQHGRRRRRSGRNLLHRHSCQLHLDPGHEHRDAAGEPRSRAGGARALEEPGPLSGSHSGLLSPPAARRQTGAPPDACVSSVPSASRARSDAPPSHAEAEVQQLGSVVVLRPAHSHG